MRSSTGWMQMSDVALSLLAYVGGAALVLAMIGSLAGAARVALGLQVGGLVALGATGGVALVDGRSIGAGFVDGVHVTLGVDPLSGFFLVMIAIVGAPAVVSASSAAAPTMAGRWISVLTTCFLGVMSGLVIARDVISFLLCWELMTIIPAAAILLYQQGASVRRAVFVYLGMTHVAGVGVWLTMLVLADFHVLSGAGSVSGSIRPLVACAALIGFGTKAGLMPLHSWLPQAHPVAPPHLSALMSGLMVKLALYGLIRVLLFWLGWYPLWLSILVVGVGAVSCVGGVLYALMQNDLKRLLAFSSIENVGIILMAVGTSMLCAGTGHDTWASIAFAASLLHMLNHSVFKSLLFLGAGAIQRAVGHVDLNRIGGLLQRMPRSGGAFMIGSLAIAGMPPLSGFASEWLIMQSLVHATWQGSPASAVATAIAAAALAAGAALAAFCFIKVVGLVLLGRPRTRAADQAVEPPPLVRRPLMFLAGASIVLGVSAGPLMPVLASLSPFGADIRSGWGGTLGATGSYPALALLVGIGILVTGIMGVRSRRAVTRGEVWACGQPISSSTRWTSAGFTKALRVVLDGALRTQRDVQRSSDGGVLQRVSFHAEITHVIEWYLYRPVLHVSGVAGRIVRRLQSGRLHTYVLYLALMVVALLVWARLEVSG